MLVLEPFSSRLVRTVAFNSPVCIAFLFRVCKIKVTNIYITKINNIDLLLPRLHDARMRREDVLKAFGMRVRQLREQRGLSQETLSEMSAVNRKFVGQVERGEQNVTIINMAKLAAALGVTFPELVKNVPVFESIQDEVLRLRREEERRFPFPRP